LILICHSMPRVQRQVRLEHCKEQPSKEAQKEPRTQNVCSLRQDLKFLHCISGGVTQITPQPLDQFEAYTNVRC
jgi:hypothetical protein